MSYQVLARKWRPKNFQEMVGQEHVLTALVNALDHNRLHHAYLFTGTRGVGKTTIARVLAKCLNCETGVSSNPCGVCASCREISEGRFVDLIEVDAASRTKVEDTRELLDNVQYAPTRGRFKVYLIDEVHMLSGHSFNALLKTLEEPPPHVKFLLATTDPQKLPVTVLSRCLQFHLKNMGQDRIVGHLSSVLGQENIGFEEPALWSLARAADGSMRDALSLTDQAIAFGNGKVAETQVNAMLGTIDQTFIHDILNALASLDAGKLLAAVASMAEQSPDYAGALADIIETLHRVAIAQTLPDALDNSRGDRDQVLVLAKSIASQDVQLFYQMALHGRRDLPLSPDPRAGFEMTLLRMLAFKPQGVTEIPKQSLPQSSMPNAGVPVQPDAQTHAQKTPDSSADAEAAQPQTSAQQPAAVQSSALETEPDPKPVAPEPEAPVAQQVAAVESAPPQKQAQPAPTEQNPPPISSEDEYFASEQMAPADESTEPPSQSEAKAGGIPEAPASPPKPEPQATEAPVKAASGAASMLENFDSLQAPAVDQDQPPASTDNHPKSAGQEIIDQCPAKTKRPLEQLTRESWLDIYPDIGATGVLQSTISNCVFDNRDDSVLKFTLDQANATLYSDGHQARFAELLSAYFGRDLEVQISMGSVASETPASRAIRHRQERHAQAVQMVTSDPLIQSLVETFAITIDPDQIEPV